jgi:hypothetical protein
MNLRVIPTGVLLLLMAVVGCNDGPTLKETLEAADAKEKARVEAEREKNDAVKVRKDPSALEHPWSVDTVKSAMVMGTQLTYAVSGTDAKGKAVEDEFRAVVKGTDDSSVGVTQDLASEKDRPTAGQVAQVPWSSQSPFFALDKAEIEIVGRETVTVPAGTFETVAAELTGFFGGHRTVWMISDKPGIYAKVIDHGNKNEADDKTELIYELATIVVAP